MSTRQALRQGLEELDGRGYPAYKRIAGEYQFGAFRLTVDHVQGDPFAEPSRVRVLAPASLAALDLGLVQAEAGRVAVADYLNRRLVEALQSESRSVGTGRGGELTILRPGQAVLSRTSVLARADGSVEVRLRVGLPARGRSILGRAAAELLCEALPRAVRAALAAEHLNADALRRHVRAVEDARALRAQLAPRGLVAWIADGSVLPRRSGVDDRPLTPGAVPFRSPDSLRVTLHAPHAGELSGMGIPHGVTLLVGGGFHGKSTLLRAIERGVYDHLPGDGRERVVTDAAAVKVRAEDGRSVQGVDISNFLGALPGGADTRRFHTANASGSTSQAAAIAEALEVGATCLLLDEDTSAANFLIRDARVQALIASEDEPITPLLDRIGALRRELGVSLILVLGGSGDYFDVADTVVAMRDYQPWDATAAAREAASRLPTRRAFSDRPWSPATARIPIPRSIDPSHGHREVEVRTRVAERVRFGDAEIELGAVEQLIEPAQTRAIARALAWGRGGCIDGHRPVAEALRCIMSGLQAEGLDRVDPRGVGEYAEFRIFELNAALSRLRSLRVRVEGEDD